MLSSVNWLQHWKTIQTEMPYCRNDGHGGFVLNLHLLE